MTLDEEAVKVLAKEIKDTITLLLPKAKFNRDLEGEIESVELNGWYKVSVDGKVSTLYSSTDLIFSVHEKVWVTCPNGNENKKYISGRRKQ